MRNLISILTLFFTLTLTAQEQKFQFGKPGQELMSMTSYDKDTTAPAVMLHENFELYYNIDQRGLLRQNYTVTRRIKVLEKEGTSYGDIEIVLYHPGEAISYLEKVDAFSFNLEDSKTVKSEVKKQMIFREKI